MRPNHLSRGLAALAALFLPALTARADLANPVQFIMRGVEKMALPPYTDTFVCYGEQMLPMFAAGDPTQRQAFCVAGEFGQGRFIAYGHRAFLDGSLFDKGDNSQFLESSLWWASRHRVGKNKAGFVGVINLPMKITQFLQQEGFSAQETTLTDLEGIACVIGDFSDLKQDQVDILKKFAEGGGGLVIAGDATQWRRVNPDANLALDYPPNKLMAPRGCIWNGEPTVFSTETWKPEAAPMDLHGRDALNNAIRVGDGRMNASLVERIQMTFVLNRALYFCPPEDEYFLPDLHMAMKVASLRAFPTESTPIKIGDVLPRLFVAHMNKNFLTRPLDDAPLHPSALNFPGFGGDSEYAKLLVMPFDDKTERMQSTGLYAPPGEIVTVEVPPSLVPLGLRVRIGAHSDQLWDEPEWKRYPAICRDYPLTATSNRIGIAFGGPLYVTVPAGVATQRVSLRFSNVMPAPFFQRGFTPNDWWLEKSKGRPAPWAEFGSSSIMFTVPSALVRDVPKPATFMQAWDALVEAQRSFAGHTNPLPYAERVVADVQPAGGGIHAGYPVVIPLARAKDLFNPRGFYDGSLLDILSAIGQGAQPPAIELDFGNSLFGALATLYAADTVMKRPPEQYCPELAGTARTNAMAAVLAQGATFDALKANPAGALVMMHQVQQKFGWMPMQAAATAAGLIPPKSHPQTPAARRDLYILLLSRAAEHDLVPFFKSWGVPVSEETAKATASLKAWTCDEFKNFATTMQGGTPPPAAPAAPTT